MDFADIKFPKKLFISGIDTDAGKSYATGWLAKSIAERGEKVITQKLVQTGNQDFSEDIDVHRRLMGCGLLEDDLNHLTAPEIYTYPASPHLSARIDKRPLDMEKIDRASNELASRYPILLIEGAGGLMVPLTEDYLTIDYIRDRELPVALVTNGTLGSLNHTLLSLSILKTHGIPVFAVIYNAHFDRDSIICEDSRKFIKRWLSLHHPETHYIEMPSLEEFV